MEEMKVEFLKFREQLVPSVYADGDLALGVEGWEEREPANITADYVIGGQTFHLTFFDVSWGNKVVDFFRPVINGFLTLMLVWFWYREVMSFVGQVSPLAAGEGRRIEAAAKTEAYRQARLNQGKASRNGK